MGYPEMSWLGIMELVLFQEDLLPRLEGWHPPVRAAGTAECIPQVALSRETKAPSVTSSNFQFSSPGIWLFQLLSISAQKTPPFYPLPKACLVSRTAQGIVQNSLQPVCKGMAAYWAGAAPKSPLPPSHKVTCPVSTGAGR